MAKRLSPIGHEEQLTLVDHLGELRNRLFWTLGFVAFAFAFTFSQSDRVLGVITKPIDHALSSADSKDGKRLDADETRLLFDQRVVSALGSFQADTTDLSSAVDRLAASRVAKTDAGLEANLARLQARIAKRADALAKLQLTAPPIDKRPITLGVTEPFLVTITSSLYAALLISLPFLLYQAYAFVIPAFTPRERQVALPLMLMVPVLFLAGVAFAYWVVLPRATDFLLNFNDNEFDIQVQGREAVKFVTTFLMAIGLMFQLPVGILAATRSGVITVTKLRELRGYAIILFAVVAAVLTPTPDPLTMMLAMAPLVVLYELSMLLASWLDRIKPLDLVSDESALEGLADHAPLPVDDD